MSKKIKNITIFMLFLGIFFVFISLLPNRGSDPKYGGVYRIPIPHAISSLNPRNVVWVIEQNALLLIFDPLIRVGFGYSLEPAICETWSMDRNGTYFECVIRKGVKFHNGKELNVNDVVFSLNYIFKKGGLGIEYFKGIKGIREYWEGSAPSISGIYTVNNRKIRIDLNKSIHSFADILAQHRIVIFPSNFSGLSDSEFFLKPVGTGPYKIDNYGGGELKVVANEEYYDGRPYLNEIEMIMMSREKAVEAFKKKQVHDLRHYNLFTDLTSLPHAKYISNSTYSTVILFPNNSTGPFDKKELRELLYALINKEVTLKKCGLSKYNAKSIIPSSISGYEIVSNSDKVYDLENGIRILSKLKNAGYEFKPLNIYYSDNDFKKCIGKEVNSNFETVGLPWVMMPISADGLAEKFFNHQTRVHIEGLDVKNEDAFSVLKFFMSSNKENLPKINDEIIDSLLESSISLGNDFEKAEVYKKIVRRIFDKAYVYPIYEWGNEIVVDKNVQFERGMLDSRSSINYSKVWFN